MVVTVLSSVFYIEEILKARKQESSVVSFYFVINRTWKKVCGNIYSIRIVSVCFVFM